MQVTVLLRLFVTEWNQGDGNYCGLRCLPRHRVLFFFFSNREQNDGFLLYSYYLQVLVCIISLTHLWVLIFDGCSGQDIIIPYWYVDGSCLEITHEIILNMVIFPML